MADSKTAKLQRDKKLSLHKETLRRIWGGTSGPGDTIPTQQGGVGQDCDDTANGCISETFPPH